MPETLDPQAPSAMNAPVETDSFCIECGYNLRGLPRHGLCPECGTLKSASLRPDLLQYADPAWRDAICRGLTLLTVAWVLLIGLVVFSAATTLLLGFGVQFDFSQPVIMLAAWASAATICAAFWLLGSREPRLPAPNERVNAPLTARIAAALGFGCFALAHMVPAPFEEYSFFLYQACRFVGLWSSLKVMGTAALRIPSAKRALQIDRRARGLLCTGACVLVAVVFHRIGIHPASLTAAFPDVFRIATSVAMTFLMLYTLFAMFALVRFRSVFREIARRARIA